MDHPMRTILDYKGLKPFAGSLVVFQAKHSELLYSLEESPNVHYGIVKDGPTILANESIKDHIGYWMSCFTLPKYSCSEFLSTEVIKSKSLRVRAATLEEIKSIKTALKNGFAEHIYQYGKSWHEPNDEWIDWKKLKAIAAGSDSDTQQRVGEIAKKRLLTDHWHDLDGKELRKRKVTCLQTEYISGGKTRKLVILKKSKDLETFKKMENLISDPSSNDLKGYFLEESHVEKKLLIADKSFTQMR